MQRRTTLLALVGLLSTSVGAAQPIEYRVVAASGQQAPNLPAGVHYRGFGTPMIYEDGRVAFYASVEGPGITSDNRSMIFTETAGEVQIIARQGDPVPEVSPASTYDSFSLMDFFGRSSPTPLINKAGQVAYLARFDGFKKQGLWTNAGGDGFRKVLATGDPAPGTGTTFGEIWREIPSVSFGNGGHIAVSARTADQKEGLWITDANGQNLTLVAREGVAAPGAGAGVKFVWAREPRVTQSGMVTFLALLQGTGVTNANRVAYYRWTPQGGAQLVVREGNPVPGFPSSVVFSSVGLQINDQGDALIWGKIEGPGITPDSDQVILSDRRGNGVELVYREGMQAPGFVPGTKISTIGDVFFNNSNKSKIGFFSSLEGPGDTGIYAGGFWNELDQNGLTLTTRLGQGVPGYPGHTLKGFSFSQSTEDRSDEPEFNDAGRLVFWGWLAGETIFDDLYRSCLTDEAGELREIGTPGSQIDVSVENGDPDVRTVRYAHFKPLGSTNTSDQVAVILYFTDGTSAVAVVSYAESCLADVNGDGLVTPADFTAWVAAYNAQLPTCDQNSDGQCTPADFTAWLSNYTIGC